MGEDKISAFLGHFANKKKCTQAFRPGSTGVMYHSGLLFSSLQEQEFL